MKENMKKVAVFFWMISMILLCVLLLDATVSTFTSGGQVSAQSWNRSFLGQLYAKSLDVTNLAQFNGGMKGSKYNTAELPVDASVAFTPWPSSITVTSGMTLEPYRPFVVLTAAGAVSTSATTAISDGWNDGQIVTYINGGSNAITVKNAANTLIGADLALGQYDTLTVYWDGYNWIRITSANN